jgi:tetratricopeptide (TPR) repeat protein
MLADEPRGLLHRRAAEILEGDLAADPEEIATHHDRGGDRAKAASRWLDATLRALHRGDGPSVLRCSDRAIELGAPTDGRFALHMARCDALRFLGRRDEGEVRSALDAASTDAERARALIERVGWLTRSGRGSEAVAAAEQAVSAARQAAGREVVVLALGSRAQALIGCAQLPAAGDALEEARALVVDESPHLRALVESWCAELSAVSGDLGERRDRIFAAALLFRQAGDVRRAAMAEQNLADVSNRIGAYAEAEAALGPAIESCRRVGYKSAEGYALANLGYSLTMLGRTDEALSVLESCAGVAGSARDTFLGVVVQLYRLRATIRVRSPLDVAREAEEVAGEAERIGLKAWAALALALSARARLAAEDPGGALALSTRAMALRDELGSLEEDEAEVFLTHAKVLAAAGHPLEADEALQRGRRRIEEIAEKIADPELRARFLRDVPAHRELMGAHEAGPLRAPNI